MVIARVGWRVERRVEVSGDAREKEENGTNIANDDFEILRRLLVVRDEGLKDFCSSV